jgi:hypothetical protein
MFRCNVGRIRIFLGNSEGKIPLGRLRHRCEDSIKMDLKRERVWGGMDWIGLAQDKDQWRSLVNTVMNFGVP